MAQYYHDSYYQNKSGLFGNKKLLFIGGGFAVVLVIISLIIVLASNAGPKGEMARLSARYNSLSQFVAGAQKKIKSGELANINSSANLLIASDAASMTDVANRAFGLGKLPDDVVKSEKDTVSEAKLKEAELVDKFDAAYIKLLLEKMESAEAQIDKVSPQTKSTSFKAAATKAKSNLKEIADQIDKLN